MPVFTAESVLIKLFYHFYWLMACLAWLASVASVVGFQCVYPAVVVIFAWPIMLVRASSLAPICASCVLKKCLAALMVV